MISAGGETSRSIAMLTIGKSTNATVQIHVLGAFDVGTIVHILYQTIDRESREISRVLRLSIRVLMAV